MIFQDVRFSGIRMVSLLWARMVANYALAMLLMVPSFTARLQTQMGGGVSTCPIHWVRPVFTNVDGNPDKLVLSRSCQCLLLQQGESSLLEAMEGKLYDTAGRLVYAISNAEGNLLITAPQPGIYLLKAENQILRVIVR